VPKPNLLPGVTEASSPPVVSSHARQAIRSARRHALARDLGQLFLLGAVDTLFLRWPATHVPMLDRHESLLAVGALNAMVIAHIALSRLAPRWTARRIASTWNAAEKARISR
jgi:hypothetical protein